MVNVFSNYIVRIGTRLRVLWRWPTLIAETLLVATLLAYFFDRLQALLFAGWLVLMAAHPGISGLRLKGSRKREHKRHSNLFAQKFCAVGLVIWFAMRQDTSESIIFDISYLLFPSLMAAIWFGAGGRLKLIRGGKLTTRQI